jgi:SAM-dependent methyltransferase
VSPSDRPGASDAALRQTGANLVSFRRASTRLGAADAAVFETFVVPRYLHLFGDLLIEQIAEGEEAQALHLFCRTGYPDRGVTLRLPGGHVYGIDPSTPAIELARAKAATMADFVGEYRVVESIPAPFPDAAFSHVYTLHPFGAPEERAAIFAEMARLVAPAGQALMALPLRGSFTELVDLLREYALKHDAPQVATGAESAVLLRPTKEILEQEMAAAGFHFIETVTQPSSIPFRNGREFLEDPTMRLLLFPEFQGPLALTDPAPPFDYVREAIDKYWSESPFTLTVEVACISGRRKPAT